MGPGPRTRLALTRPSCAVLGDGRFPAVLTRYADVHGHHAPVGDGIVKTLELQARIHRGPGAPARRWCAEKGDEQNEPGGVRREPDDHGLGRSRGGLTTV